MRKVCLLFLAGCFLLSLLVGTAHAVDKTVQINIQGCWTWSQRERVSSILKKDEGVIKFDYSGEAYTILFNDEKTTTSKIIQMLEKGGFKVKGEPVVE